MISRRRFLSAASASAAALGLTRTAASEALHPAPAQAKAAPAAHSATGVSRFVDPMIGTGGHGHNFPGATVPFGMVQVGPDTYNDGWDHCSGYHHSDESLMGFSHTHLSGTGCGDLLDVLLMPGTGRTFLDPSGLDTPERGYRSRFSHQHETAVPGYYSVFLRDSEIKAEMTATARVALHRYSFPAEAETPHVLLDFLHASGNPEKLSEIVAHATLTAQGNDTLTGGRTIHSWAHGRQIYFAARFSQPWNKLTVYNDNQPVAGASTEGHALKAVANFGSIRKPLLVKVALSPVSVEQALANLNAELPGWDFEAVRKHAAGEWERELSRVAVEGTERQKRIFYTSLYHCMAAPTIFSDADGSYRGMDGKNHKLPAGDENFSTYSLWDTYRALHPLFTLVQPERTTQLVNGLIRMAQESPSGPPIWPLQGKETFCMTGWHSVSVVAEAVAKQIPGLRIHDFLDPMRKVALDGNYRGHSLYRTMGYLPADKVEESIGNGLDFAFNDWGMARIFEAAGEKETAAQFRQRSANYKNFFDKGTGFMRPRLADGSWAEPFAPNEIGHSNRWRDYTESNPWQATFAVQHDPEGLAQLLGGRAQLEAKLDGIFSADPALPPNAPNDIAGFVGQYAHGNEPSHHIPFLYIYAGAPWKTQARVRQLLEKMYYDEPDGLAGNEDCGQMSAWFVMAALGLYAVDPVSANYVLTSPLVRSARIKLAAGKTLEIAAVGEGVYIQSVTWNGKPLDRLWISHKELAAGGKLSFRLATEPNKKLGTEAKSLPPSMTPARA
ncbi:MAG: GH92 family glycosyl hydrolase [Terracidiphilus sp.]|nr:GH92 family glycosyl hydrolase [Terracidiphilus sp.]